MAVSVPVAAALIAVGGTVYAAQQQKKIAREQEDNANNLAAQSKAEADKIDGPTTQSSASQVQAAEMRAASAGGTMTGSGGDRVGDIAGGQRKQLLGG